MRPDFLTKDFAVSGVKAYLDIVVVRASNFDQSELAGDMSGFASAIFAGMLYLTQGDYLVDKALDVLLVGWRRLLRSTADNEQDSAKKGEQEGNDEKFHGSYLEVIWWRQRCPFRCET
jgi:hypothetical protein